MDPKIDLYWMNTNLLFPSFPVCNISNPESECVTKKERQAQLWYFTLENLGNNLVWFISSYVRMHTTWMQPLNACSSLCTKSLYRSSRENSWIDSSQSGQFAVLCRWIITRHLNCWRKKVWMSPLLRQCTTCSALDCAVLLHKSSSFKSLFLYMNPWKKIVLYLSKQFSRSYNFFLIKNLLNITSWSGLTCPNWYSQTCWTDGGWFLQKEQTAFSFVFDIFLMAEL